MPSILVTAAEAARKLEDAGVPADASRRDAARLARAVLGWDEAQWLVRRSEEASAEFTAAFAPMVARRAAHEPLAYILGEREFYGRPFAVARAVLIPRPETELIVEEACRWLAARDAAAPMIVDVGTGSGCLAVTLALECRAARLVATDISAGALEIAAANAARHQVADRIRFVRVPLTAGLRGEADLVVANPPYVAERDRASLPAEVREYEPAEALFGGPDGLDVIRALAPSAAQALRPGGRLLLEIGAGQSNAVNTILEHAGFTDVHVEADLAGIPRMVVGERR